MKNPTESNTPYQNITVPDYVPHEWSEASIQAADSTNGIDTDPNNQFEAGTVAASEESGRRFSRDKIGRCAVLFAGLVLSGSQMVHETIEPVHILSGADVGHSVSDQHEGDILDDFAEHPNASNEKPKTGGAYETDLWELTKLGERTQVVVRGEKRS